jgi:hypothetical protein
LDDGHVDERDGAELPSAQGNSCKAETYQNLLVRRVSNKVLQRSDCPFAGLAWTELLCVVCDAPCCSRQPCDDIMNPACRCECNHCMIHGVSSIISNFRKKVVMATLQMVVNSSERVRTSRGTQHCLQCMTCKPHDVYSAENM